MCYISAPIADEGLLKSVAWRSAIGNCIRKVNIFDIYENFSKNQKSSGFQGVSEVDIGKE